MDNKEGEEYEDISFDIKDDNNVSNDENIDEEEEEEVNSEEANELSVIVRQLSKDYSNYFKFDINSEKKETEDAIEDMLTHLEEFCGLIEMIRNDNNICLEEVLKQMRDKSGVMDEIYAKIDKLEQFVQIVKQCVDDMDAELTQAEQLFGYSGNNRVKRFFSAFISSNTSKQNNSNRIKAKFEPKDIFNTNDYIKSCHLGVVSEPTECQNSAQSSQTINGSID